MSCICRRRGAAGSLVIVILSLIVAAAAIGGILYLVTIRMPSEQQMAEVQKAMLHTSGLGTPVKNKLDAKFADINGDYLADLPTDAAQLVDPSTLTFSYIATEDPDAFKGAFKDLVAALSKATGKPVEYMTFTTTEDELKAMRDGKLHIVGLGTGSVPIAVDACGFIPVCSLGDDKGKSLTQMEIIVAAGSGINNVQDLKGKELTLTEPGSNSGYKAPLVLLKNDFGMLPGRDYGIRYSGGQDQSIKGIASKQYQAAAVASDVLQRDIASGMIKQGDFRSIYRSGSFPSAGLGYAYNLKPELAEKIKNAMIQFDWKGTSLEKEFTVATGQNKFTPVVYKDDWVLVRKIDDEIGYAHEVK